VCVAATVSDEQLAVTATAPALASRRQGRQMATKIKQAGTEINSSVTRRNSTAQSVDTEAIAMWQQRCGAAEWAKAKKNHESAQ